MHLTTVGILVIFFVICQENYAGVINVDVNEIERREEHHTELLRFNRNKRDITTKEPEKKPEPLKRPNFENLDTSPGVLVSIFQEIYQETGVFPDTGSAERRVTIKSMETGQCLDAKKNEVPSVSENVEVVQWQCHGKDNQLIYLDHVGDGYVVLRFDSLYCLGTGIKNYSPAYLATGTTWCKNSESHQWSMRRKESDKKGGDYLIFVNKETGKCLTSFSWKGNLIVGVAICGSQDLHQKFQVCDQKGKRCSP